MPRDQLLLLLIPVAYLIGSIPFGLLVGRAKGIDPRTQGSGNIGATNLGRLLGRKYFALVFTLDFLKGALPPFIAGAVIGFHVDDRSTCLLWIITGAATIAGHVFSVFLKFKGGKGVATSAGVFIGIFPYFTIAGLVSVVVFIIAIRTTRYISVGSMLGAAVFPIAYVAVGFNRWPIFDAQLPFLFFAIAVPVLIILKHRGNIARLRVGSEPKISKKP